jgi:HSP20 family molecular chaperone IbpA|eukprot:TRINITY_DN1820_c0_g1_i2.p1 TRINITY_DN1820_c0_g1~~TRINITY_DN1820_c0_g1_i2.p1  ORF type:complete len:155 (+),score=15.23 TRINITY_DN1820_c0_g1_i2:251-715(+)
MSRMSVFNSPLLLGFDHFERTLDRISKSTADGYPPYNIEQTSSDGLRITLAVAGFGSDELSVQIEDSQLVIRGRQIEEDDRIYLHRGIAARQFLRTFVLAEGIEVVSADLDNGLLHIDLRRPMPEVKVQTIEINAGKKPASRVSAKKLDVERAD